MTVKLYDFRKPPPLPPVLASRLENWLREVSKRGPRLWSRHVTLTIQSEFRGLEVVPAGSLISRLPETALRFRVGLGDGNDSAFLVLPRTLLLSLLTALLNEPVDAPPADRELTAVEEALAEHVALRFFLDLLRETWSFPEKLELGAPQRETPRSTALWGPDARFVVATSRMHGVFGEHEWLWVLPRSGWLESMGAPGGRQKAEAPPSADDLRLLVRELPVRMTVRLGNGEMSLLEAAELQAGDVVMLEQKVAEPLTALLGGKVKFHVWSGAVGARQAIQVESLTKS